jgi:hypothetical protein
LAYSGLFNFILMFLVELVVIPLFWILFNLSSWNLLPQLFLVTLLGTLGFCVLGTILSAVTLRARARELLLPLVLFPLMISVILATIRCMETIIGTGEFGDVKPAVNKDYAGYTFGYNRPLLAQRVHDILTAIALVKSYDKTKSIHLVGFGKAGPWVVLARGLCGDAVERTAADLNGFRFEQVKDFDHEMMLPGALKYGGLLTLAGTIAPHELYLHNAKGTGSAAHLQAAYQAAGQASKPATSASRVTKSFCRAMIPNSRLWLALSASERSGAESSEAASRGASAMTFSRPNAASTAGRSSGNRA